MAQSVSLDNDNLTSCAKHSTTNKLCINLTQLNTTSPTCYSSSCSSI